MIEETYDVVVVGSGAAGLTAAVTASLEGKRVLLLEATDRVGGTTAISGGMVWLPANHKMQEAAIADSEADARRYLEQTVPGAMNDRKMDIFLKSCDAVLRYLEARTSVKLQPVKRYPDYYPDLQGAKEGARVLEPVVFDGLELGKDFRLLRDPLPEFLLFGGMMISREDIPRLRRFARSPGAAWHVMKLVGRFLLQRLRAHRGTTLVLGNALAARLFKSARDLGVDIVTSAQVLRLTRDADRVDGVEFSLNGQRRKAGARNAVILATGGLSHDEQLRSRYVPQAAGSLSATVNAQSPLRGARLASRASAALSPPSGGVDDAMAFWVPASTWKRSDGTLALFPHTVTDRAKPGLIAVGSNGRRFVNEAVSYHEFVRAQLRHAEAAIPAWLICDSRFLWKYGLGRVRPFSLTTQRDVAEGYLKKASSLQELASQIGVDAGNLLGTIEQFNNAARNGEDPEFSRGANVYQRHLGDGDHAPNPCVAPIESAPFYAVCVTPADLGMSAGIMTNEYAQALRQDGSVIPGLYACGNDMHSIMNGAYPGPGITLGPALVFGHIAGLHAANPSAADELHRTVSEATASTCPQ
ncbi:FAD-dependent oxidoreductase [Diaphorobacter ruginosibacter]|uniref:FAD-dependent oxidoreductase n=1 Tax=Diaphorobacter ruginosibacter TaxID=1715720 RepID=UPI00333F5F1B